MKKLCLLCLSLVTLYLLAGCMLMHGNHSDYREDPEAPHESHDSGHHH